MEELTNEGKVESWLPFLNNGHFKTAIVGTFGVDGDGCPNVEVIGYRVHASSAAPVLHGQAGLW